MRPTLAARSRKCDRLPATNSSDVTADSGGFFFVHFRGETSRARLPIGSSP